MSNINLVQFLSIETAEWYKPDGTATGARQVPQTYRYQNFFVQEEKTLLNDKYDFAPFRVEGTTNALNGDNGILQVLFPYSDYAIQLVERGNGNRLSQLTVYTLWLPTSGLQATSFTNPQQREYFLGVGASFSETTIELRFRSAIDSVGSNFPARSVSRELAGYLPNNADLVLQ
jgi:hypothetical protein